MSAARDHINRMRAARGARPLPPPALPTPSVPHKRWDIWSEGYVATGERAGAMLHARDVPGDTFADAVARWAATTSNPGLINMEHLTFWGCRLYDNEAAARRRYG